MNTETNPPGFLRRRYERINTYFRTLVDPESGKKARFGAAARLLAMLAISLPFFLILYTLLLIPFTPSIADIAKAKVEQPSILISADGKQLAAYKRFNREWVALDRISPHVVKALIATEDHRFYQHYGIDFYRLGGAALNTLSGKLEGGSTITQQLARNLYPEEIGRQRSITRKLKETITALKIELAYSKPEILETYLNTVPFLYNAFGIEMAARTYFDKPAARLSMLEGATLIGMLKGTSYYNPVLNLERATARRNVVLSQMRLRGVISQKEFDTLKKRPIRLDFERQLEARGIAPHFAEHMRKWLIEWADRRNYNIYSDGLKVYTTIDSRIQAAANQAVKRQADALQAVADVEWARSSDGLIAQSTGPYVSMRQRVRPFDYFWSSKSNLVDAFIRESASYRNAVAGGADPAETLARLQADANFMTALRNTKTRLEAGFVALDPTTGDVKAWVGSRDFDTDQYDHVARAQRQPGSTFKPFVYGAALAQGMPPDKQYIDQVIDYKMNDGTVWSPKDVGPATGRQMTARDGLIHSKNTVTAQVMQEVGPAKVANFARDAGIRQSKLNVLPSLALGTSPVTLLEMAGAYGTIANGGEYRKPMLVARIEDKNGRVLVEFSTAAEREMSRETSEELIRMLRGAVDNGTGQAIRTQFGLRADLAGKTGTTQDNADGWFMLMHPRLVAGAWIGFNDTRVTMRSNYWGQGARNALPVTGDFFRQVTNGRMIDVGARFPRARDAQLGASIWGPVLDEIERWFGIGDPPPRPEEAPRSKEAPKESRKENGPVGPIDEALEQVREVERQIEEGRRSVEKMIDGVRKALE